MTTAAQAIKTSISRDERTATKTRIFQVLCTKYDVAVGIGWHRDKPHFDKVFGLSLGSACKFRFRRPNTPNGNGSRWRLGHVRST
jgi:alkylated DNA repair dioxygenase AlkB